MEFRQLSVDLKNMNDSRFDEFRYIFTLQTPEISAFMPKEIIAIKNREFYVSEFYVSRFRLIGKNL